MLRKLNVTEMSADTLTIYRSMSDLKELESSCYRIETCCQIFSFSYAWCDHVYFEMPEPIHA